VILRYDSPQTLFYCDPPYPHEAREDAKAYAYEMTARQHEALAELLRSVRGAVALSGYRCPLLDRLYGKWRRVDADTRLCNSSKGERAPSHCGPTTMGERVTSRGKGGESNQYSVGH
jgi:DNA adenine methylase